jgi:multidrug transporter EmrE-like cation transporter
MVKYLAISSIFVLIIKAICELDHTVVVPVLTGATFFMQVMFEVYSFRENHSTVKKRGLSNVPTIATKWRATSSHDDSLTSYPFCNTW